MRLWRIVRQCSQSLKPFSSNASGRFIGARKSAAHSPPTLLSIHRRRCRARIRWHSQSALGSRRFGQVGRCAVIYFTRTTEGEVVLLTLYAKSKTDNLNRPKVEGDSPCPRRVNPLTDAELTAYEAKRDLAAELLQSVREMKAGQVRVVSSPVIEARNKTGLSQSQFAALMGVSVRTLQGWEQGRKQPSGAARTLLAMPVQIRRHYWRWHPSKAMRKRPNRSFHRTSFGKPQSAGELQR